MREHPGAHHRCQRLGAQPVAEFALRELLAGLLAPQVDASAHRARHQALAGRARIVEEVRLVVSQEEDDAAAGGRRLRLERVQEQHHAVAVRSTVDRVPDHHQELPRSQRHPPESSIGVRRGEPRGAQQLLELDKMSVDVAHRPDHVIPAVQLLAGDRHPRRRGWQDDSRCGTRAARPTKRERRDEGCPHRRTSTKAIALCGVGPSMSKVVLTSIMVEYADRRAS